MTIQRLSPYRLRPLDPESEREIATIASFSLLALLETRPESRTDSSLIASFSHQQMMTKSRAAAQESHQIILVAVDGEDLVGHSHYRLQRDGFGCLMGYFAMRYVLPAHRRQGLGARFLREALAWFEEQGASYALAHVHRTNLAVQRLFAASGFVGTQEDDEPRADIELRKELAGPPAA